jgi:hypothetical protein
MLQRILPLVFLFLITSCVEDLDFEQAEALAISPVLEASLLFFDFQASSFDDPTGTENLIVRDELEFDFFNEEFIRDNLARAEFFFEITNSIDRDFRLDLIMYDINGIVTHMFDIAVVPDGNNEIVTTYTELFEDDVLEQLKNTTRIEFILTAFPHISGIPFDATSIGKIKMRSKATLFFEIDTE